MEAYTGFASVYDEFMDNVPYDEWTDYLVSLFKEYQIEAGQLILELGCGTGSMTRRLFKKGYDMIGLDYSDDMLEIAREKDSQEEIPYGKILYLNQDMREFELYGTVACVISICDSMNYITDPKDLKKVFSLVNNYLDPGGLFIFDLNTVYKYQHILADSTIAENREDASFIWENYYDEKTKINEYDITIYKKAEFEYEEEETPLFERMEETHYQRAYEIEEIKQLLTEAGMEFITSYEVGTKKSPSECSERVYIIAREQRQKNKLYINER